MANGYWAVLRINNRCCSSHESQAPLCQGTAVSGSTFGLLRSFVNAFHDATATIPTSVDVVGGVCNERLATCAGLGGARKQSQLVPSEAPLAAQIFACSALGCVTPCARFYVISIGHYTWFVLSNEVCVQVERESSLQGTNYHV
jgi:hypothetical protein